MQNSNARLETDQQKNNINGSVLKDEGQPKTDKDILNLRNQNNNKKNTFFSSVPQQNSFIQFDDKGDFNDDKETVVDISFISQSSNKQQFANKIQGLQLAQFNKNTQSASTNKIEILNNTDISLLNKFSPKQNQIYIQDKNKDKFVEQSFSNQNTDASKNSSVKRDDRSENTQKISSTEVYSIPGPKNINSSQYQYVQPNQLKSLNQIQMSQQQASLNVNDQQVNNNILNQIAKQYKNNFIQQNQPVDNKQINHINKQNYQKFTLLDSQLNMYPTLDKLVGDDTIENLDDPQFQKIFRLNIIKIFSELDLKETQKQKLLKDQYCIHKTEYYEVDLKVAVAKNQKGNKNIIAYSFIIKNKTLSDIKEVSISLHNNPKNCDVEFDRAQIQVKERSQETIKMNVTSLGYPLFPIKCSFLIGNYVPIKHFEVYHNILQYVSQTLDIQDLIKWNPKYEQLKLDDCNPNLFLQKSFLEDFYYKKLKEENNSRVGFFQIILPLKRELKISGVNILRFKIILKVENGITIGVSDFYKDYYSNFKENNLKLIQDQILLALAYTFSSNQSFLKLEQQIQANNNLHF
ncbi:hypothetical protein TTHERM_00254600 (macronuclear) [Tetrahymena thermophila SB210]|uniref:Uncharacterized protein n=1 Tax=Tetrahymena thermophila (strain SB210) TaxID=312017 RepID=Q23QM0_TETTS|nr:hypothetical protein TTHERM_00254600 [Tetrahymena thermophila SB210]EAR98868.3 hypothetical protein TTHERM_00254600 [Tetrahymena thermophila SB210]|eukprot:XP_001019113.3 hypothetical protein TTHERM_00254600 [Tetrahymena thermophila SB210]